MARVSIVACKDYEYEKVKVALAEAIAAVDGFGEIKSGMFHVKHSG